MKYPKYSLFWALVFLILFFVPRGTAFQNPSHKTKTTPLTFGQVLTGTMRAGETLTYTFTATAGKRVIIRMCKTSGMLNPAIHLQGPDGISLKETWSAGKTELISDALQSTGTYFIIAGDYWGTYEGEFSLALERLNPGKDVSISFGQTVSGVLVAGDLKSYVFYGTAGDRILIRMRQTSAAAVLYPQIRLYNPEGIKLREEWAPSVTEIRTFVLPINGIYTILVSDYYGAFAEEYTLILERFNPAK